MTYSLSASSIKLMRELRGLDEDTTTRHRSTVLVRGVDGHLEAKFYRIGRADGIRQRLAGVLVPQAGKCPGNTLKLGYVPACITLVSQYESTSESNTES